MAKLSRLTFILLLLWVSLSQQVRLVPSDDTLLQTGSQWGFMKNIINIDTFFYDPAKHKQEQEKQKKDEAARKKKEAEDKKYL